MLKLDVARDRARGALLGLACGDALGWPTEGVSTSKQLSERHKTDRITGYVRHRHGRKGEYSDDTQLTLAVARSIRPDASFDTERFAGELAAWPAYMRGYGYTSSSAAEALAKGKKWNANFFRVKRLDRSGKRRIVDYRTAASNGAAMRVAPLAITNPYDPQAMALTVWCSAIPTHGSPSAILGALVHAEAVRLSFLCGKTLKERDLIRHLVSFAAQAQIPQTPKLKAWLARWDKDQPRSFEELWEDERRRFAEQLDRIACLGTPEEAVGYLKQIGAWERKRRTRADVTVWTALVVFSFCRGELVPGVLFSVNLLGSDTDTLAAMVGTLCGARSGMEAVPSAWLKGLQDRAYIDRTARQLARIATGQATGPAGNAKPADPDLPELAELLADWSVEEKMQVRHPIFGAGVVQKVTIASSKRRDADGKEIENAPQRPEMLYARVRFASGQSCRFRARPPELILQEQDELDRRYRTGKYAPKRKRASRQNAPDTSQQPAGSSESEQLVVVHRFLI